MLEKIKLALRFKNNLFDNEISMYISSCKNDLKLGGVDVTKLTDTDEVIINTVVAYCKWQLNFQNRGQEWEKIYKSLKTALVLDINYNVH